MSNELMMWVIYADPSDFPGKFVLRQWRVRDCQVQACKLAMVFNTIEDARLCVPSGRTCTAPYPEDDPKIAEVWL